MCKMSIKIPWKMCKYLFRLSMERMKILSNNKYNSLIIEIETLKEIRENDEMCINMMADRINRLEEENKNLKDKIKHLEFDVDAWHQLKLLLEWEIEKLREELSAYDREYFDEDKKAKNIYKSQKENILMWKI